MRVIRAYLYGNGAPDGSIYTSSMIREQVPKVFTDLLACSPIRPKMYFYWWRSQAAAYVFRPNTKTLAHLASREKEMLVGPNPHDGVGVHVRHADKEIEMDLVPFKSYLVAARSPTPPPSSHPRRATHTLPCSPPSV